MSLNNITLLYVEDERPLTETVKSILEDELKEIYVAYDGVQGVELYKKYRPDIVLSDIYMPHKDGIAMSTEIKEINPDQPIIFLTAFSSIDDLKKAIEIGIDHYINKPVKNFNQLSSPLEKIALELEHKNELERLRKQMEILGKYAAIGEVQAHITHQWKQPLTTISAILVAMKMKIDFGQTIGNDELIESIDGIYGQVEFLAETLSDFKDYLKPLEKSQEVDMTNIGKKIKSLIGSTLVKEHIDFILNIENVKIHGYMNKIMHVLMNIINNARDAIVSNDPSERVIILSAQTDGEMCHITIKDSAGGIPEKLMEKIFEAYFTTKDSKTGTGLGLYMAREFIVIHMKGKLEVFNREFVYKNQTLKGACFDIQIPLNTERSGS